MTPILRMRPEYIKQSLTGRKSATTRLHPKSLDTPYELASGDLFHPKKSGVLIKIYAIREWTLDTITDENKDLIYRAEGFTSWKEFWKVICEINQRKNLRGNTNLYTMFYEVLA